MPGTPDQDHDITRGRQPRSPWRRPRTYVALVLLVFGAALCVVLVRELGADRVWSHLAALGWTLPWLFALEGVRFGAELMSTRLVLAPFRQHHVPPLTLLRGQCLAHTCNKLMPAGRAVGEGLKAAVLAPTVGAARAIGVGAASQIMTLLVNGAVALTAGVVAFQALGAAREAAVLGAYGVATTTLGVLVVVSLRSRLVSGLLSRWKATASLREPFARTAESGTSFGPGALAWHTAAKVAQAVQLGVLLSAVGVGVRPDLAWVAEGVQIVGAAAGDLVPAQLGATEGAFTLAASTLGLSAQAGLSVAVALHGTQLLFAGSTLLLAAVLKVAQGMGPGVTPDTATRPIGTGRA